MRNAIIVAALAAAVVALCPRPAQATELEPLRKIGGTSVTCGTTATLLDDTDVSDTEHRHVLVCNLSSNPVVYVKSSSTVTTSNGIPIRPGDCYSTGRKLAGGTKLYCISTEAAEVRVSEAR